MLGRMFAQNNIIGTAMQASVLRNDVILNNIANADTPNFSRSVVDFEDTLAASVDQHRRTGNLDLSRAVPTVRRIDALSFRLDGNNVDIESEMVNFFDNAVRYDVMATSIMSNYRRINMVITTR